MPLTQRIMTVLEQVPDPEIPVLSILDLGIVREVRQEGRTVVAITPTYSGCPASHAIQQSVRAALDGAGLKEVDIAVELSPPWSTDWITESGRKKLSAYGIAPPVPAGAAIRCPQCGSAHTEEISRFGSTPCKALHRCLDCAEPFDLFKCH